MKKNLRKIKILEKLQRNIFKQTTPTGNKHRGVYIIIKYRKNALKVTMNDHEFLPKQAAQETQTQTVREL